MPESEEVMLDSHGTVVSAFSRAFARQNSQFEKAIQALVSLNEQISTSLVLSGTEQGTDFQHRPSHQLQDGGSVASRQQQAFDSSVALMRRLLLDAQAKFRRMVEENKELAARIDGDIQQAQEEVAVLRGELADTSRRLDQHLIAANTHLNNASSSSASSTSATAGGGVRKKQLHSVSARNLERASKMPVNSTSITSSAAPAGAATPRSTTATPSSCSAVKSTAGGASRSSSPPQPPSYRPKGSTSGGMSDSGNSGVKSSATGNVRDNDEMEDDVANVSAGNGDKNLAEVEGDGQNGRNASYSGGEGQQDEPVFRPPSPIAGTGSQPDGVVEPTSSSASSRPKNKPSANNCDNNPAATMRLRLENERLQSEVEQLRKLVGGGISDLEGASAVVDFDDPLRIQALEIELQHAKEALAVLKADRKRLKAEKYDLLNQMKELYATLDDKEKELRDFIRNYDKIREQDSSMQQLSTEREERERERWSLLRHARDEAERSLSLAAQLEMKEQQLQQLQEQLQEARRQLAGQGSGGGCLSDQESLASMSISVSRVNGSSCGLTTPTCGLPGHPGLLSGHHGYNSVGLLPGDRGSCSADSGVRGSSDRESGGATSGGGNLSDSTTDAATTPKDCSPSLSPLNANTFSKSMDSSVLSRSVEQLSNPLELEVRRGIKNPQHLPPPPPVVSQQQGRSGSRGGTWGSISRVFARSRHRKVASPSSQEEAVVDPYRSWSPLTEEGYAEKLRLLREAASIPMERWRAPTVLAWLEIALGMPQYGPRCAENVKSGKVLLELSDVELEVGLGITHPMHRKKLRLAIEEHRHPALVRYPCIAQLGHTWVSSEWLPDLGLAQYSENFATNMVDARMLDHLSKKELEKFLGVTRKFHQASVVHGIHLLRMMKYDRQAVAVRRHQCESIDADPLVWTNQRFIRWARNIDLGEYAENLKDSGVHGALVVLEPSFTGDTMATALGIPPSKNIIRRHLATELEALVLPARASFEHFVRVSRAERRRAEKLVGGGSLGRSFSRSCAGSLAGEGGAMMQAAAPVQQLAGNEQEKERRRASLRGSLSRVLGLKLRQDSHSSRQERDRDNRDRDSQTSSSSNNYYVASPSSSSENSSSVINFSCRYSPPPYHGRGLSPTRVGDHCRHPPTRVKKRHHHRRVKSIGDIDAVTITPV